MAKAITDTRAITTAHNAAAIAARLNEKLNYTIRDALFTSISRGTVSCTATTNEFTITRRSEPYRQSVMETHATGIITTGQAGSDVRIAYDSGTVGRRSVYVIIVLYLVAFLLMWFVFAPANWLLDALVLALVMSLAGIISAAMQRKAVKREIDALHAEIKRILS